MNRNLTIFTLSAVVLLCHTQVAYSDNVFVANGDTHAVPVKIMAGGTGGAGDASAANQTAVQANPGSDATKAQAVQGVTGGKAVPVSIATAPVLVAGGALIGKVGIDQTTPGTTNAVSVQTSKGAANYANGQVATSTTAATLVAARATRRSVSITNYDATITVYIGGATVTAANGYRLLAGQSVSIDATGLIQVIAASGTPTVGYIESYD